MQEHRLENEVLIHRPQEEVFRYVTQPWRWHEWHPASECATPSARDLVVGDSFEETVSMRPFGWVPIRMRRQLRWTVLQSQAPHLWEVHGTSPTIDVRVLYEMDPLQGTRFRRTFHYAVKGWLGLIERRFVLPRMQRQSVIALQNLKRALEAQ
jgi:uncharacterized protein YndB with AHSA1/START domain